METSGYLTATSNPVTTSTDTYGAPHSSGVTSVAGRSIVPDPFFTHSTTTSVQDRTTTAIDQKQSTDAVLAEAIQDVTINGDFVRLNNLISADAGKGTLYHSKISRGGTLLLQKALEARNHQVVQWILSHENAGQLIESPESNAYFFTLLMNCCADNTDTLKHLMSCLLITQQWTLIEYCYGSQHNQKPLIINAALQAFRENKLTSHIIPTKSPRDCWNDLRNRIIMDSANGKNIELLDTLFEWMPNMANGTFKQTFATFGPKILLQAVEANCKHIVEGLMAHTHARIFANAFDSDGNSPIHLAVRNRCKSIAMTLKHHHCDLHRPNKAGATPQQYAESMKLSWAAELAPSERNQLSSSGTVKSLSTISIPTAQSDRTATQNTLSPSTSTTPVVTPVVPKAPEVSGAMSESISVDEQIKIALRACDFNAFGEAFKAKFTDRPVPDYSNITYLVVDDDKNSLLTTYPEFRTYPGSHMHAIKKNIAGNFGRVIPVVTGNNQPYTNESKIVVVGHGPRIAGMRGDNFAEFFNHQLGRLGCPADICPRITLSSCKTAQNIPNNFVEEFIRKMASLGRYPEVTACQGAVITFASGLEICGDLEDVKGCDGEYTIARRWQGPSAWLNPEVAARNKIIGISQDNYDETIVQVYVYDKVSKKVIAKPKHSQANNSEEDIGGLKSLMPPKPRS